MATLHISEYAELGRDENGNVVPVGQEKALATQSVTYTTAASSSAFGNNTRFIRVIATAKAHLRFGVSAQTAVVTDPYIAADSAEYFGVVPGQIVSAYDGTS